MADTFAELADELKFNPNQPRGADGKWSGGLLPDGPIYCGVPAGASSLALPVWTTDKALAEDFAANSRDVRNTAPGTLLHVEKPALQKPVDLSDVTASGTLTIDDLAGRVGVEPSVLRSAMESSGEPVASALARETSPIRVNSLLESGAVQGLMQREGFDSVRTNMTTRGTVFGRDGKPVRATVPDSKTPVWFIFNQPTSDSSTPVPAAVRGKKPKKSAETLAELAAQIGGPATFAELASEL